MKKGYVCKGCPPVPEGHKVKFWPRRDNFKAHAVRKHVSDKNKKALDELLAAFVNFGILPICKRLTRLQFRD